MGLDTTHNCWHGPYSSFHRFRTSVAFQIGINLDEMEGFDGSKKWDDKHDLYPLLSHSDCDGELTVSECKKIHRGLTAVIFNFNPKLSHDADFIERVNQFMDGLKQAINKKQKVKFQ